MNAGKIARNVKKELRQAIDKLIKDGALNSEWLERNSKSSPKHILHSRVLGLLAQIDFGKGWITDIERSLKPSVKGRNSFTPDIIAWKGNSCEAVVIEYESINSSDSRVISRDLENYKKYIEHPDVNDCQPIVWIIVTTLKSGEVQNGDWSRWDWAQQKEYHGKDEPWEKLLKSPFNFWHKKYIEAFKDSCKVECPIYWMNIDSGNISIEFPLRGRIKGVKRIKDVS